MDVAKSRKAAAAKLYWIQQEGADGNVPDQNEVMTLEDLVDYTEHLTTDELELLRITYLALKHAYGESGLLEFPSDEERAQLARQMLE